ncbi:hypothetical protein CYLTODRAFT_491469 [Cylindrobasidium torrendii FP15055 ss-10]|uniref:Uncharacterized protein n=1 Tax=Cylindrobasidium torrendii FP15055 ss-10 TaxID=1314674 RepID=A0A0D7B8F6_9AGAR|nr:hypothetical protein CYLTODRAFT_491469 [Cylindrobasidium torrendii FP15055 ss-10]
MAISWEFLEWDDVLRMPWGSAKALAIEMDKYCTVPLPPTWLATGEELSDLSSSELTTVSSAIDLVMKKATSTAGVLPASSGTMDEVPLFPLPVLNINDLPDDHPHSLRRCANLVFTSGYLSSEMRASETLVPILRGLLYVPGCCTSEAPGPSRTRETVFTSRMILDGLPEQMWPLATVALPRSWSDSTFAEDVQEATEALAHAFQPTLEFILSLYRVIPESDPTRLPYWILLCGFYYTSQGIHVRSHRPRWDPDAGQWRFQSVTCGTTTSTLLHSCYSFGMGRLIRALLMVQRCIYEVKQGMLGWLSDYGEVFRAHGFISSDPSSGPSTTTMMASELTLQLDNIINQGEHAQRTTSSKCRTYLGLREIPSDVCVRPEETLSLIRGLHNQWNGRIALPLLWTRQDKAILATYVYGKSLPESFTTISILTAPLAAEIECISDDDVLSRHKNIDTPEPDFCLARYKLLLEASLRLKNTVQSDARHNADAMARMLCCPPDDDNLVASALYGMLCGIPNCRITLSPSAQFPPSFLPDGIPPASLGFCVMPEPCHPAPHNMRRSSLLGPTLTHPALLIAIDARSFSSYDDESSRMNDISRCLAMHAEPNLHALREAWCIFHNVTDGSAPVPPLPEYAIVYGIAYDSEKVDLFAHFWSSSPDSPRMHDEAAEMVSLHIDRFTFSTDGMSENLRERSLGRLRLGVALLTIQKQLYRLASLWEEFDFPCDIRDLSENLDDMIGGMERILPKRCLSNRSDLSEGELWEIEGRRLDKPWSFARRYDSDDEEDEEEEDEEDEEDDEIDFLNFDQYLSLTTRESWLEHGEIERIEEWAREVVVGV